MYRLRFDVETRNVATTRRRMSEFLELRFDVETRNVATGAVTTVSGKGCGLM